jgi:hypothetical protein
VIRPTDQLEVVSSSRITTETEDFSATPAISSGRLVIRSNKHVYCFMTKK